MRTAIGVAMGSLALAACANAAILFDFGPTGATQNPTHSPAHVAGAVPASETTWNRVTTNNLATVLNGDGTTATGVMLTWGSAADADSSVTFNVQPSATNGGGGSQGVYAISSAVKTSVFNNLAGSFLGLRIDGLAAGEYELYIHARNTATPNSSTSSRVYYLADATAGSFSPATAQYVDISNAYSVNSTTGNETFYQGVNYQKFTVTITDDDPSLYVAVRGTGVENRPFINSLEIVAVPEPTLISLAGLTGMLLLRRRHAK
jgi:hypothetical protein